MNQKTVTIETIKQYTKLTDMINEFIAECGGGSGIVNVFVQHTTCAIKILEGEILLLSDISCFLNELFPKQKDYRHDVIEVRDVPVTERINGFSHMRQLFFSSDASIPVKDGKMMLGQWQDVFLIEFDPIRGRDVIFTFWKND